MNNSKMKNIFVDMFTRNIWLKLLSLGLAVILWLVVVNVTDPVITQTFRNVPVKIINESSISADGKTMEVVEGSNVVSTVTVKAPRTVIRELGSSPDYINIIADMNNLSQDETSVPLMATTTKYSDKIESVRLSQESLEVVIENRKTVQLRVTSKISGQMAEGYVTGRINQAQNQVKVSGPESVINRISKAMLDVEVTGFTEDISTSADIELYDENGNEIINKNIEMNVNAIKVDVEILATKVVPVKFDTLGTPAEGYALTGDIEAELNEIMVAGKQNNLDMINYIQVPGEALNVNGLTSTLRAMLSLSSYLPNGIVLADGVSAGRINVAVYIEPLKEEVFSVYLRNIDVINIPDGFSKIEWDTGKDYVEFTLVGLEKDLNNVQLSSLDFSVDFSDYELMNDITGFKPGRGYALPLLMDLPEGVNIKEPVTISVKLSK